MRNRDAKGCHDRTFHEWLLSPTLDFHDRPLAGGVKNQDGRERLDWGFPFPQKCNTLHLSQRGLPRLLLTRGLRPLPPPSGQFGRLVTLGFWDVPVCSVEGTVGSCGDCNT